MRSRASDAQMSNNARSRSMDRVSNSNLDLSRLSRSITDATSTRFNSLTRVRAQKSSLDASIKKSGLVVTKDVVCSTLPTRGRFNSRPNPAGKLNFKGDPCYTSNVDHLVYANSARSSFNVKYGGNLPKSMRSEDRRALHSSVRPDDKRVMHKPIKSNVPLARQQTATPQNKTRGALNTSCGGSKSFDVNALRDTPLSTVTKSVRAQPNQLSTSRPGNVTRNNKPNNLSPSSTISNNTRGNNGGNKYAATRQQTCYKAATNDGNKANNNSVARGRLDEQQCDKFEDATMLHSNNKVATTTTILQETTPNRRNNVSILQVRSVSEPNSAQTTIAKHQVINNAALQAARVHSARNNAMLTSQQHNSALLTPQQHGTSLLTPQQRPSNIPVYRSNAASLWKSAAGKIVTCAAKSKAEAKNTTAAREMSPVRWCDQEVQGVYLGSSGWVQVYQQNNKHLNKARSTELESLSSRVTRPESLNLSGIANTDANMPPYIGPQQYSVPQQYARSVSAPVDPGPTILLSDDEQLLSLHTPIISPPLAFQDERDSKPLRSKLPRSNAFDFPDPDEVTKAFMQQSESRDKPTFKQAEFSPTKKQTSPCKLGGKIRISSEESSGSSTGSFRTAASSGGMRSVTPSWRGGSIGGGSGGGGSGGGGRHSCDSCSSESSRHRSSSEESLSLLHLSPERTTARHRHTPHARSGARNNGVLHLSDSNTHARKHASDVTKARRTVTSPESSTSSASSSPVRHVRGNRLEIPPRGMSRAHSSAARSNYNSRVSPQCDTYQHVKRSTSLQLPAHEDYPPAINYRHHKPVASQETTNYQRTRPSKGKEDGANWHHAELRAVTDYLSSTRSRTAARALLLQRYLNQQGISPNIEDHELTAELMDEGRHSSASFNVVYVPEKPVIRSQDKVYAEPNKPFVDRNFANSGKIYADRDIKTYADRDNNKGYGGNRDNVKVYRERENVKGYGGERENVKTYGDRENVKGYGGERENVKTYGDRENVKGYGGERDNVKTYGERENVKGYGGERDNVKTYGERENVKGYGGERENVKTYGDRENVKGYGGDRDNTKGYGGDRESIKNCSDRDRVYADRNIKTYGDRESIKGYGNKSCVDRDNVKTYADREGGKTYGDRESVKTYGDRESVKTYGDRESVKTYADRESVKTYADRESVKSYGDRESVKSYGDRESVKTYGDRESVKSYGDRESVKSYGDRENKIYAERDKSRSERDKSRLERDKTRNEREMKSRSPWVRGSSAPLSTPLDSDEEFQRNRHQTKVRQNNTRYQQCCNPATCDFWPECEHQITSPQNNRKPYLCQIRPSLSYPSPCSDAVPYTRSAVPSPRMRERSITAPCSLDRVDEDTPPVHVTKRDDSPVEKNGFRNSSSEDLSTSADDLDAIVSKKTPQPVRKSPSGSSKQLTSDAEEAARNSKSSPKPGENPNLLSTGRPHSADCLLRRRQYTTTGLKAQSERSSPIVEETPRKSEEDEDAKGAQQRSLSLPKSFLSSRQPQRPAIVAAWPETSEDNNSLLRVPYSSSALSTPSTPGHVSHKPESGVDKSCFGKERASSGANFLASALRHAGLTTRQRRGSELSVLQKFKKSFAQRFARKVRRDTMGDCAPATPLTPDTADEVDSPIMQDLLLHQAQLDTDAYFKRIGPAWRHNEPNSNGNISCRNSKCSSGDSGCLVEQVVDTEIHEVSPEVTRRLKTTVDNNTKSRPLSEVLTETFLDKYKLEEGEGRDAHTVRRTHSDLGSPLHIDPLRMRSVFKRQISSPSPLKMRPVGNMGASSEHGLNSGSEDELESNVVLRRTSAASTDSNVSVLSATPIQRQQQLRRSISQPTGINELSPLLRRRPAGIPSVTPRRVTQRRRVRRRVQGAHSEDEVRGNVSSECEDEETDSESSASSRIHRVFRPLSQVVLAEAVWDHVTLDTEELAFKAGQLIEVVDCTSDKDWWFGHFSEKKGWFPAAFVRFRVSQEDTVEDCLASMGASKAPSPSDKSQHEATSPEKLESSKKHSRTRSSVSLMSNDQVRASVVREIISTERDFVRNLTDVVEGYLWECRRREDLFTSQQLMNIFGNIEELLEFQTHFLSSLETKVIVENPTLSCLGHTFLSHSSGFHIYSEYCNGHPIAQATLQELYAQAGYKQFFEACRLVRGLINISLDGFLLTPVQRICKYPLQLGELLKYTRPDHADYEEVRAALEAMRSVATLVNERKRRMESLEKLSAWQQRVEGWEGEDLIDLSSQLIHQGEAVRVTSGRWSSNVKLFLFDRQLLYCKRDLLRRGLFVYKGRIALDHCAVMDVPDGKDIHLGISVRHGIKLVSRSGPSGRPPVSRGAVQWLLLCFRSADEKVAWLRALNEERLIVQSEQARGLQLEPSSRELARLLTKQPNTRPSFKPNAKNYSKRRPQLEPASSETSLGSSCQSEHNSLGRKVGHWFTFSHRKQHRHVSRGGSLQQLLPH